ncbi:fertility inhibition FinO-like protein [Pseudanabaena yagii]|uniref:Fertility inhibition FinO-like protein n=1 Tax=Pseudanabaena yagii GIHE-NHR1 TaxID=2722753 RepID=A0ABX1LU29_9CYAN|nr:fertility inhibition FinO-like protein [Pseudanabaena yagii]NMF59673.1 fertility inhibition FinO-like protein [Pseudanabaena yagii GIHE-NHR1]
MLTSGNLELIIKIDQVPTNVITHQNGWKSFRIKCDERIVNISVRPKVFKRLEEGTAKYGHWTAEISGKMGESTNTGFILEDPIVQVFQKKAKDIQALASEIPVEAS